MSRESLDDWNRPCSPDTEEESEDVRLLLFVELTDILVCAHLAG